MANAHDRALGSALVEIGFSVSVDLVIGSLQTGGAERQLVGLALGLAQRSIDVRVLTLFDSGPLAEDLMLRSVSHIDLSHPASKGSKSRRAEALAVASRLTKVWRQSRPAAMQAWLPEAQIIALPVARLTCIPRRVMALRSMSTAVSLTPWERSALRWASRFATDVTGNSAAVVRDAEWPGNPRVRTLIRNGLSLPDSVASTAVMPPKGITVANFTQIKGHSELLDALSRLGRAPAMTFVGNGPRLDALQAEALRSGLRETVSFRTGVRDPLPFLLESQFFVLPSPSEGLPNAVMEAMAAGLPIVAFRVGGIPEIVEDGVTGVLVDPGDVQGLADAIAQVAADPAWRVAAGASGRERMKDLSWDAMIQRNMEIMGMASP